MSSWRIALVSLDGTTSDDVEGVSGSITWDGDQSVQGRASITVTSLDYDWLHHRVRIFRGDDPVFTGYATDAPEDHVDGTVSVSVSLMDYTGIPAADPIPYLSGVPEGADPLGRVAEFLAPYGLPVVLPDLSASLQAPITWSANTANLTRINDLLAAAGCGSLRATAFGILTADPLLPIDQEPVADRFSATDLLYLPTWSRRRDVYQVPNRVTATARTPGGQDSIDVTVDLPATSSYSLEQTGKLVSKDMGEVDAADSAILTALATRELESSQAVVETRTITHEWAPHLRVGMVVEHEHHLVPTMRSRIVSQRVDMTDAAHTESTLEGVS